MKLAFPNGEHDDVAIGKGSLSIGNSPQDDVVVNGDGSRAVLIVDQRGITLSVEDSSGGDIEVNSRPVREKAILRLGDRIRFGSVSMVIQADSVDMRTPPHPFEAVSEDEMPAKNHLRGISGKHAGKVFAIRSELSIGSSEEADIQVPSDADIELAVGYKNDQIYLRRMDGQGVLDVNGLQVKHAELKAGDQIAIGDERFLLETPSFVPGDVYGGERVETEGSNTQVFSARAFSEAAEKAEQKKAKEKEAANRAEPSAKEKQARQEAEERARAAQAERDARPTKRPPPPKPASEEDESSSRRDMVIIAVCVILSAAMIIWLVMNL